MVVVVPQLVQQSPIRREAGVNIPQEKSTWVEHFDENCILIQVDRGFTLMINDKYSLQCSVENFTGFYVSAVYILLSAQ